MAWTAPLGTDADAKHCLRGAWRLRQAKGKGDSSFCFTSQKLKVSNQQCELGESDLEAWE